VPYQQRPDFPSWQPPLRKGICRNFTLRLTPPLGNTPWLSSLVLQPSRHSIACCRRPMERHLVSKRRQYKQSNHCDNKSVKAILPPNKDACLSQVPRPIGCIMEKAIQHANSVLRLSFATCYQHCDRPRLPCQIGRCACVCCLTPIRPGHPNHLDAVLATLGSSSCYRAPDTCQQAGDPCIVCRVRCGKITSTRAWPRETYCEFHASHLSHAAKPSRTVLISGSVE
jgi:hypothetical protein